MRITQIYTYPIKALRPMAVTRATLRQQGFEYDRRYMLLKVEADGGLTNVQILNFPACARLFQDVEGEEIVVTHRPPEGEAAPGGEPRPSLRVPLRPDTAGRSTVEVRLFGSSTQAYRMGPAYDAWFSACLSFDAWLVYIGDGQRAVLAHSPRAAGAPPPGSWRASLASLAAYVLPGGAAPEAPDWLTFNEAAPYLVATEASLRDVGARLPAGMSTDMLRFRPNIVVDGDVAWDEDFWTELQVHGGDKQAAAAAAETAAAPRLALTANCGRCRSINIDYATGRVGEGEAGTLLKKLMKDRRVDAGNKWSPVFGRYAFLMSLDGAADIAVGDEVSVTKRSAARSVWQWPPV